MTALVLSRGEPYLSRALESLAQQSWQPGEVLRVDGVSPFCQAFNQGVSQVTTPFLLQVDADMILDRHCLERLRGAIQPRSGLIYASLRDDLMGEVVGIKLMRTHLLQRFPLPDSISTEVDWVRTIETQGWESQRLNETLGRHQPDYTPEYTFIKFARWSASYRALRDLGGLRWHVRELLARRHPARFWALAGLAEGLSRANHTYALGREPAPPDLKQLEAFLNQHWPEATPPSCGSDQAAFQLGRILGRNGRLCLWDGAHAWAGALGLISGLMERVYGRPHFPEIAWEQLGPQGRRQKLRSGYIRVRQALSQLAHQFRCKLGNGLYLGLTRALTGFPLAPHRPTSGKAALRVGYLLWRAPGESFVQREMSHLEQQSVTVFRFALEGPSPHQEIIYQPQPGWLQTQLRSQPLTCLRLLAFLLGCTYRSQKQWPLDLALFQQALWLARQVREHNLSALHSPWAHPCALVVLLAARLSGVPCSVQVRAHELNRVESPGFLPRILPGFQAVVTNSNLNLNLLRGQVDSSRLHRIYNGTEPEAPLPSNQPLDGLWRILCVARLVDTKGIETLLSACAHLRSWGLPFHCTIVGGTEEPIYIKTYIRVRRLWFQLQLQDWVTLSGELPHPEVRELYRSHQMFAFPAQIAEDGSHDVTPNSLLEAMAVGLPIVTTHIGAISELVEPDVSALFVPPRQPEALARALQRLMQEPELGRRLGEQARRRCRQQFTSQRQACELAQVFSGLT